MRAFAIASGVVFAAVWMLLAAITGELSGTDAIVAIGGGIAFAATGFVVDRMRQHNS